MLHDRRRGVVADVANGDVAFAGGGQIHVVGAGRREADQAQRGQCFKARAVEPNLVDQQHLAAGSPGADLRVRAGWVKHDVR